jgi:hypothetical protein
MSNNNKKTNQSITYNISKLFKDTWEYIRLILRNFSIKYPETAEKIQLFFIYFFAIVDLSYSILNNIFSLGYMPEGMIPIFAPFSGILDSSLLKVWASPEKVFFISYVTIEFMVIRPIFKFSKLIKYNIILIFALLMIQGLIISYWDLFFHKEITIGDPNALKGEMNILDTTKILGFLFFLFTFFAFLITYGRLYVSAINKKFPQIKSLTWVTDSAAFWLRIMTPTMKFRKDGKDGNDIK